MSLVFHSITRHIHPIAISLSLTLTSRVSPNGSELQHDADVATARRPPPGGRGDAGGRGRRRRRRVRRRGAEGALLPAQLPRGGGGGARHRAGARGRRPRRATRQAAPPLLPRLLRQGVRRVGADRLDAGRHGGEGRGAERVAGRLRRDRHREGRAGGHLPRHRLLRRHRGARRQGRRLVPVRSGPVGRAAGAARRRGVAGVGGAGQPPLAVGQLHHPRGQLRQQGPRRQGPRHPLRRAHDRRGPLQHLRGAPLRLRQLRRRRRRPDAERGLRGAAPRAVRAGARRLVQQRHGGGHGPRQPGAVRRALLRQPQAGAGPIRLRRRAAGRPPRRRHDPPPHQAGILPPGVQERRAQDGPRRRAHRRTRGDPPELQGCQLRYMMTCDHHRTCSSAPTWAYIYIACFCSFICFPLIYIIMFRGVDHYWVVISIHIYMYNWRWLCFYLGFLLLYVLMVAHYFGVHI